MLRSVRARLTIWYTAILALVLITFSVISYGLLARENRAETDSSLAGTAREFTSAFSSDSSVAFARDAVALDFRYSDREIIVISPSGTVVAASRPHLAAADRQRIADLVRSGATGFHTVSGGKANDGVRLVAVPIQVMGRAFTAVVARDLAEQSNRLRNAAHAIFFGIPLAMVIAAVGGYLLARQSLQPVTTMSLQARHISAETLGERIPVRNEHDELGFLAATLNGLLERLQLAFASQRSFMADASHELRTPVAIIRGEADVVLSRDHREESEYRESIATIQKASVRLSRIVDNLFLLARTDAGSYPIARTRFYLADLVDDAVRAMRSIAASREIALSSTAPPDYILVADEELMSRLLLNLIENAVKFTAPGGRVTIEADATESRAWIRVSDSGPGIPPAEQEKIFERFYRGDRARRGGPDRVSGAGLGLPIARWIAEAHGGSIRIERSDSSGTTFLVAIPQEIDAAGAGL